MMNDYPIKRNQYFSGKLLSAGDFQSEQDYFRGKNHLMNRLIYGGGILCGFHVDMIDDQIVSIDTGVALDYMGREIVLIRPEMKKLSLFDGFQYETQQGYLYLCAEYAESDEEPTHSMLESTETIRYNKCREGCHLYLTEEEGDFDKLSGKDLFCTTKTVYQDENILVSQSVPKFVKEYETLPIEINVKRRKNIPDWNNKIKLSYTMSGRYLHGEEGQEITAYFDENDWKQAGEYRFFVNGNVLGRGFQRDRLTLTQGSFAVCYGDQTCTAAVKCEWQVDIFAGDVTQAIQDHYFLRNMDDQLQRMENERIYLARIYYSGYRHTYAIDRIEPVPFDQYIESRMLGKAKHTQRHVHVQQAPALDLSRFEEKLTAILKNNITLSLQQPQLCSGITEISLGARGKKHGIFFSDEIVHGLGEGLVHITLGQIQEEHGQKNIYFGSEEIFGKYAGDPVLQMTTGVRLNAAAGTFQIGIRLMMATNQSHVKIVWTASKDNSRHQEVWRKSVTINPEVVTMSCRQEFQFSCDIPAQGEHPVMWMLPEESGGSIDQDGIYKAPGIPGVYEIQVKAGDREGKAYVIVQ